MMLKIRMALERLCSGWFGVLCTKYHRDCVRNSIMLKHDGRTVRKELKKLTERQSKLFKRV